MDDTNQHYITRAHLDKFVHPESGQAVLYPYRKGGGACKPRGTKKLGSAMNFYRQKVDGTFSDSLDEARKQSETLLFSSGKRNPSPLATCVFQDDFVPAEAGRLALAAAAAFLMCGSPVQIHNSAMWGILTQQMWAFNKLNTDEVKNRYDEQYGEEASEKLEEDRKKFLSGDLFVDVGVENWKQLGFFSFQMQPDVIGLLLGMQITVVDCHYRSFFLTSDNPVVRIFPSSHGKLDDEVWFPISYKRGLLWHRRDLGARTRLGYSETRAMNRRIIKHSYKFVYAPLPEDWIEAACRQETFDPLLGHYRSLNEVIAHAKPAIHTDGSPCGDIVELGAVLKVGEKLDVVGI